MKIQPPFGKPRYYKLEDHSPVPVDDVLIWAEWFEEAYKSGGTIVKSDMIQGVHISTVFLGLDNGFNFGQPGYKPLLFETMVFGGELDFYKQRYSTWLGAESEHDKIVEKVKATLFNSTTDQSEHQNP